MFNPIRMRYSKYYLLNTDDPNVTVPYHVFFKQCWFIRYCSYKKTIYYNGLFWEIPGGVLRDMHLWRNNGVPPEDSIRHF